MSKRAFLATVILLCSTTATALMMGNNAAMSEPILIDPTSRYYGEINNYRGEGYAYDFCYQQNTLGYIVVSRKAAERLENRYPVRSRCQVFQAGQSVSLNLETNTLSLDSQNNESYRNSYYFDKKSGNCSRPPYKYQKTIKGVLKTLDCTPAMRRGN